MHNDTKYNKYLNNKGIQFYFIDNKADYNNELELKRVVELKSFMSS